jgi:precorrin-6A/cobalt-precorrin-6A reductase
VLILGGTQQARRLAGLLAADPALRVTSSLAGRVAAPRLPAGEVRIGGFGGPAGLACWVSEHHVEAIVDATHPFAEAISGNAVAAAAQTHVPLLALRRPGWVAAPGDRWHSVGSVAEAVWLLPALGERVFLTIGRMELAAFAGLDDLWFLIRSVDPPQPPLPARCELVLDRGPFTVEGEAELLRRHRVDVLVTKDSGGPATAAKLTAARRAGLPVVVIRRPPAPQGVPTAATEEEAVDLLARLLRPRI